MLDSTCQLTLNNLSDDGLFEGRYESTIYDIADFYYNTLRQHADREVFMQTRQMLLGQKAQQLANNAYATFIKTAKNKGPEEKKIIAENIAFMLAQGFFGSNAAHDNVKPLTIELMHCIQEYVGHLEDDVGDLEDDVGDLQNVDDDFKEAIAQEVPTCIDGMNVQRVCQEYVKKSTTWFAKTFLFYSCCLLGLTTGIAYLFTLGSIIPTLVVIIGLVAIATCGVSSLLLSVFGAPPWLEKYLFRPIHRFVMQIKQSWPKPNYSDKSLQYCDLCPTVFFEHAYDLGVFSVHSHGGISLSNSQWGYILSICLSLLIPTGVLYFIGGIPFALLSTLYIGTVCSALLLTIVFKTTGVLSQVMMNAMRRNNVRHGMKAFIAPLMILGILANIYWLPLVMSVSLGMQVFSCTSIIVSLLYYGYKDRWHQPWWMQPTDQQVNIDTIIDNPTTRDAFPTGIEQVGFANNQNEEVLTTANSEQESHTLSI